MAAQPSPRRRFQFRLRTLMIVVTLLALPGAYVATQAKFVRARSAWKTRYEHCHFPCISWGGTYDGPDLPPVRRWLGDQPVSFVLFEYGVAQDDVDEAKTLFPEAEININLVSPGYRAEDRKPAPPGLTLPQPVPVGRMNENLPPRRPTPPPPASTGRSTQL
jgi:hypothetical protein